MKILIVCSYNSGFISPFIKEQAESLERLGVMIDYYPILGQGLCGYLKNLFPLMKKIESYAPDLIHAHYGLSGLLASIQRKISVVTTFHGSDVNMRKNLIFSFFASIFSRQNIFVHPAHLKKLKRYSNSNVVPCGIDFNRFYPQDKGEARRKSGLKKEKFYGLFSSGFTKKVKNFNLAKKAVGYSKSDIQMIELSGYSRTEVRNLLNAVDFLLMTSISEGSPQIIKEAMACNCPIVTTDVGDVRKIIGPTVGCFITSYSPRDIGQNMDKVIQIGKRTNGRKRMKQLGYDLESVGREVLSIYHTMLPHESYSS
jgi:glycosyltransferase involved in cell wall biosynthesis